MGFFRGEFGAGDDVMLASASPWVSAAHSTDKLTAETAQACR